MSPDIGRSIASTVQHIALLRAKYERLRAAQIDAEMQLAQRAARGLADGSMDLAEASEIYQQMRGVAQPGWSQRWQAATGLSTVHMRRIQLYIPNRDDGGYEGTMPLTGEEPAPRDGQAVVYVLYDVDCEPCYVGSTIHLRTRLAKHRSSGKEFAHWLAYPCDSREAARTLETQLLQGNLPYLNKRAAA